ncbi:MAG: alpha/beta hydrolase [Eubacteriales bacterium]
MLENLKEYVFGSSGETGQKLCGYAVKPAGEVTAVLQVVHGVAEHFGRYGALAGYLSQHGVLVCGHDQRGHGKSMESADKAGFFGDDGWEGALGDIVNFSRIMGDEYPGVKYTVFGHSMGSFMCRELFMKGSLKADGFIFSGTGETTMLAAKGGRAVAGAVKRRLKQPCGTSAFVTKLAFGSYNKAFGKPRTSFDWISSDPAEVDAYIGDEYCGFPIPVSLFIDMLGSMNYIRKPKNYAASAKNTPVLLISGRGDPVGGKGKAPARVYKKMLKAGVNAKLKMFEGRHELLREKSRREVMEEILSFIKALG